MPETDNAASLPRTIYVKVSTELLAELSEWSEPVRVKVERDWNDDTFELIFKRDKFDKREAEHRASRTLAKPSRDENSLVRTLARDVFNLVRERDDLEQRLRAHPRGEL